jgi:hypothetical protein
MKNMLQMWSVLVVMLLAASCTKSEGANDDNGVTTDDNGSGGGGTGSGGGGSESDSKCETLQAEECERDDCVLVRLTQLKGEAGDLCRSGEQKTECRTVGEGCSDGDVVSYFCDGTVVWESPQTCGGEGMELCEVDPSDVQSSCEGGGGQGGGQSP